MNTKNLKAYAPKARNQFIEAVKKRAAFFGIYQNEIMPITFQGDTAIIDGEAFTKAQGRKRQQLEKRIEQKGFELFIREMAYTWFNRLAAIRFMELHDYLEHSFRVLSNPTSRDGLPEILDHASDVADMLELDKAHITELQLAGDKQESLYRELLLGQCHYLQSVMPFLFEAIDDATELLLPDNLTKTDSILKGLVNDIPEDDWQEIEVIGWLYQFYISEHKDAVIGKVVKSEDIPAATQLFTPNWIVKYLVQNSVGRQWLSTYPDSEIKEKMEYYIEPAAQTDEVNAQLVEITPTSIDPEMIKVLDPAVGSGHILVEVYELLREIYLDRGYRLREIPELILTKNIFGLDIDDRAAQLAGFALMMKAREDDRRIFHRVQDGRVKLNIFSIQSTDGWDCKTLWQSLNLDGKTKRGFNVDMFIESDNFEMPTGEYLEYFELLKYLIISFKQAKTIGSLVYIDHQYLPKLEQLKLQLSNNPKSNSPTRQEITVKLISIVDQAIVLAQRYDAVIANSPYMGSKGMNSELKNYAKKNYPKSKSDLFAIFMEMAFLLLKETGHNAQINMQSWMFLSSYEELREELLNKKTIISMAHFGARAFGQISGEVVQTTAWVMSAIYHKQYKATFLRLVEGAEEDKRLALLSKKHMHTHSSQDDFFKIPSCPLAYWVKNSFREIFTKNASILEIAKTATGLQTSNSERFIRYWWEVSEDSDIWIPLAKGGGYRKWYGNVEHVVNWGSNGKQIKDYVTSKYPYLNGNHGLVVKNESTYFNDGVLTSRIASSGLAFRIKSGEEIYADACTAAFPEDQYFVLGLLCSKLIDLIQELNPTINFQAGDLAKIPVIYPAQHEIFVENVKHAVQISKLDWEAYERSKQFPRHGLLRKHYQTINEAYSCLLNQRALAIEELKEIEEENNQIIINSYALDSLIDKNVDLSRVSLTQNTAYTFNRETDTAHLAQSGEAVSFISFSLGCMMGRFSLDREGLVYALSGNKGFNESAYNKFPVDDDGIIPLASEEWLFEDDATARFREFVKTVWGTIHLQENIKFIAESLCLNTIKPKKSESALDCIRRYFSTQFFADHCKMYKKRPIYWLFSTGKEKAFECLVYLHRYNDGTLSRMRTEYVTPIMGKYESQHSLLLEQVIEASGTEQRRIEKEIKSLAKKQVELRRFDEELKHYAEMRISLDLDDGVKINYGKFGNLLANVKDIHGKAVK